MFYNITPYFETLAIAYKNCIGINKLKNSSILITGSTGLIGSYLVDLIMYCNNNYSFDTELVTLTRNENYLKTRFASHINNKQMHYIIQDITSPLTSTKKYDYIIHAASNSFPFLFSTDPVGTIINNITGIYNLLEYGRHNDTIRILYLSTGEVYGEATDSTDQFDEIYYGSIDILNPRSCYPMSKRTCETLLASYNQQYGNDFVIARPCHIYGANTVKDDNRATAQFFNEVTKGNNIILKSNGTQYRSYCHVADCASGLLSILCIGNNKEAYNIANPCSNISIIEFAKMIALQGQKDIVFSNPEELEKRGYNIVKRSILNPSKLLNLGWNPVFDLKYGIKNTLDILQQM